jgi:glycosyltransferase involved in cell wall biosynthesis
MATVGGSEQVARELVACFPGAHLWTIAGGDAEAPGTVVRSPLAGRRLPPGTDRRALVAIASVAWRHGTFRAADYDLVVSSHHSQVHTAPTGAVPHLCYVHSPARYAWLPEVDERGAGALGRVLARRLRRQDLAAAGEVDDYAANSATTAARIRALWHRAARVIHPPVRVGDWPRRPAPVPDGHLLSVSRLIGYKRLDFTIALGEHLGVAVEIVGTGPDEARLRDLAERASVPVTFHGHAPKEELVRLLHGARALAFPGVEDFGLVPVEAMACGVPVVAYGEGGATETVVDGTTGALVGSYDLDAWAGAIEAARHVEPDVARARALEFDVSAFRERVRDWAGAWV